MQQCVLSHLVPVTDDLVPVAVNGTKDGLGHLPHSRRVIGGIQSAGSLGAVGKLYGYRDQPLVRPPIQLA